MRACLALLLLLLAVESRAAESRPAVSAVAARASAPAAGLAAVGLGEESAVAGRTAVRPGKHLPGDVAHPRPGEGVVHGVIHGSSLWLCGAPVAPSTTSMRDVSRYVKDISR